MVDNFKLWYHRDEKSKPMLLRSGIEEPVEGVDIAENELQDRGIPGQSYCKLVFNGDSKAHTTVYFMDEESLGILNAPDAKWPVFYPPDGDHFGNIMLEKAPFGTGGKSGSEDDSEREHKRDDDSRKMKIDGQDDDDEDEMEDDEIDDGESEDDAEEDREDSDDGGEDEFHDDGSSEDDSDDDETDDDDDDGSAIEESDSDSSKSEDRESEEPEMPRLKIFAKMRGPKSWRKRADAEDLLERNVFGFKVGVLDETEGLTAAQAERDVRVQVEFIERDDNRETGLLRLKFPGMDEDPIVTFAKSGWINIEVPYQDQE